MHRLGLSLRATVAVLTCLAFVLGCSAPSQDARGSSQSEGQTEPGVTPTLGDVAVSDPGGWVTDPGGGAGESIVVVNPNGNPDAETMLMSGIVRDFSISHEDFEKDGPPNAVLQGMVQSELGLDGKPVYAQSDWVSPATFAQWYADVEGVNAPVPVTLQLTEADPGVFVFDSDAFFPIDGMGFGNEGNPNNFHFTTEFVSTFSYKGGEVFTFVGDDDLWVFINSKLALDLGGTHRAYTASVDLDEAAVSLGLEVGKTYTLSFFHAERHTTESNFRIETTIRLQPAIR